ncbi:DDE-type integrase/transposase/recombinase [Rhodobacter sp. 24-YEA-8]|uniref:DDE-type integrase/transposase/recombinase n=1 Tax=Rhodobacter sp. 24-YEA-8 TaxID=1884310 RepID=UPI00089A7BF1|nr:DDE-type integrase/transposase/recombinase [Rhodobacter sp. 24-YEA-8]SEC27481.1 putative transposase [Rhodobacter sp. 24-YEA-8]
MIERDHPALSIGAQCRLLSISRSSFCHEPAGETDQNLGLMQLIDRQFMDTPFYGVRQMTWHLQNEGHGVNQKRIRRLMRLMRLMPIYQKPNTSKPRKGHKTYPYLLGGLRVDRPGQVWCADITYLPMRRGFLYLVAIMDWFTRKVLAWRISNTLEADFCVEALNEAIHRFGAPTMRCGRSGVLSGRSLRSLAPRGGWDGKRVASGTLPVWRLSDRVRTGRFA